MLVPACLIVILAVLGGCAFVPPPGTRRWERAGVGVLFVMLLVGIGWGLCV